MLNITKTFPGVIANNNVSLRVKEGEVHALLGENGAGKSTLMSILFGTYLPDKGHIRINGEEVTIQNPRKATELKIGMVHQHFKLVHNYTSTQNIVLGREPHNRFGLIDLSQAEERVRSISQQYGLNVDPTARIEDVTVGQQQRVEILKTLYSEAELIILDEPTAVLTPQEIEELIHIIQRLKKEGKTIILITHKLKEILSVADRCTVLRRGTFIGTVEVAESNEEELARMMVGRTVKFERDRKSLPVGKPILSLKNISVRDQAGHLKVDRFSLDVRESEIVGIAGVDGNGQSELLHALCGLLPIESGSLSLDGVDITSFSIRKRIEAGLGLVPEDRQRDGLIKEFTLSENFSLKDYYRPPYSNSSGLLKREEMEKRAAHLIEDFDVRAGEGGQTVAGNLSGGNQQKMITARELALQPKILVVAQPSRGLDVGAIEYIHERLLAERENKRGVLLISFELDEIMNLCDRIATIAKGQLIGLFPRDEISTEEIGLMMAGIPLERGGKTT